MHRRMVALALAGAFATAFAQVPPDHPEWKEMEVPPPPALRTQGLVRIEVPSSSLRFGIDPASIAIGSDSVVRYVVVATSSSGTVNALYEGIRCSNGDMKVYARHNPDSGWVPARSSEWTPLTATPNSKHSLSIARSGVCLGRAPNGTPAQIVRDLRAPADTRFENGGVNR
jgi:hypothetical protein